MIENGILRSVYKRELHRTVLALEAPGNYREGYQMKMMAYNQIPGLLEIKGRGVDDTSVYEYDISGKKTLQSRFTSEKMGKKEIRDFLTQFNNTLSQIQKYFLDENCLLLDPEYIFLEKEEYYFCYYPPGNRDIKSAFHRLTEFFVKQTDYEDEASIHMAFVLHKETMEENYSLGKIIEGLEAQEDREREMEAQDRTIKKYAADGMEEEPEQERYGSEEHDWITRQEMGSRILKETDNLWTPVKRFLQKHRKTRWGEWDELNFREDEL